MFQGAALAVPPLWKHMVCHWKWPLQSPCAGIAFLADATGCLWLEARQPHQFRLLLGAFKRDVGGT